MDDVGEWLGILRDPVPESRQNAACALGEIGDARALIPLIERLDDMHWGVRAKAAKALEKIGFEKIGLDKKVLCLLILERYGELIDIGKRAVPALIEKLGDKTAFERDNAARALVEIGDLEKVRASLEEVVRKEKDPERKEELRGWAVETYAKIAKAVSERKKEEMPGVLSNGKVKPPKSGIYRTGMGRVANG